MFRVIVFMSFFISAFIWGDLKNWKKYYSTILFTLLCSLYYDVLYSDNPLWRLEPIPPLDKILFNNTLISLALAFFVLIPTALIFLSNYPSGKIQILYFIFWVIIYSIIELIMFKNRAITYHNGWSLGWSFFSDLFIFSLIRMHFLYPLIGWGLAILSGGFIWIMFGFPMKP